MAKKIGFYTTGTDQDNYMYVETASDESYSLGADIATGTFNINMSTSPGSTPDESTSNLAMEPSTGDVVLQSSGTGVLQLATGAGGMKAIGIAGTVVANTNYVTIDTSTGQLGSTATPTLDPTRFLASLSSDLTNATGDGSEVYPLIFNNAILNVNSAYNASTGIFVAPASGTYLFTSTVTYSNVATQIGNFRFMYLADDLTTVNARFLSTTAATYDGAVTGTIILNMAIGEGMAIDFVMFNGTKTITINGHVVNIIFTTFSGYQIA